jgi:uracil phosphoribosyltransferase
MSAKAGDGMFSRDPDLPNLIVTRHPLLRHKLTLLRKRDTPKKIFKELVDEIAMLLAYEVTSDLETETVRVETPLESTTGDIVRGERLTLVPILRAGLGMVDGVLDLIPTMRVGHIGLQRDHDTLEPIDYYFKIPLPLQESVFIVADPMLATGGSASAAVTYLKDSGARNIRMMCIVSAPEGVRRMLQDHPLGLTGRSRGINDISRMLCPDLGC